MFLNSKKSEANDLQDPSHVTGDLNNSVGHAASGGDKMAVGVRNTINVQVVEAPLVLSMGEARAPKSKAACWKITPPVSTNSYDTTFESVTFIEIPKAVKQTKTPIPLSVVIKWESPHIPIPWDDHFCDSFWLGSCARLGCFRTTSKVGTNRVQLAAVFQEQCSCWLKSTKGRLVLGGGKMEVTQRTILIGCGFV